MSKGTPVLFLVMAAFAASVTWASVRGFLVKQPEKKPVSIREGSVRHHSTGRHRRRRTRYFVGGGFHGGK